MSQEDERRALAQAGERPRKSQRKYRCENCGLQFVADDLNPDYDEDGRRIGWLCDGCY